MSAIDKKFLFKQGSNTLFERAFKVGLGLGIFLVLIRYFNKEAFGIWVLYMTFNSIIEISRIGLIKNAIIKYYIDKPNERQKYLTAGFFLHLIFSLLIVLLIFITQNLIIQVWESELLAKVLLLFTIIVLIDVIYFHNYFLLQANLLFWYAMILTLIRNGIFFGSILIVFVFSLNLTMEEILYIQIFAQIIATIISIYFTLDFQRYQRFKKTHLCNLWEYGKYVVGTSLSSITFKNIDKLMLGALTSPVLVAVYDTAMRISVISEIPGTALPNIFFPLTAKHIQNNKNPQIDKIYEESTGILLGFLLPIVILVLFFADFIIIILGGREYADGAQIMRLGILLILFLPFNRQFGVTMDAIGLPKINFYLNLTLSIFNVILNYFLILQYGIYGAISAAFLTGFISFIFIQFYLKSMYKVSFVRIFKYMILFYQMIILNMSKVIRNIW